MDSKNLSKHQKGYTQSTTKNNRFKKQTKDLNRHFSRYANDQKAHEKMLDITNH